jgi:hypothetical protein
MMKRISFFVLSVLLACQAAHSQEEKDSTSYYPFLSIGFAYTDPGDIRPYYNGIVNSFRSQGVPVPTQIGFGRTVVVRAGFLYYPLENIGAGISIGYSYSPAYSGYEDYGGSLKVNGSISVFDISLRMQNTLGKIGDYPLNLGLEVGDCHLSGSVTQEVRFNDFPDNNLDWELSNGSWAPCIGGTIGSSAQFGMLIVSLEAGYKHTFNKLSNNTVTTNGVSENWDWTFDLSQSGFILLLSFGTRL